MFRKLARRLLPNRLDWMLKRAKKKGKRKVLLGWNRGLGDIPLGLFAIVHRIRTFIPDAQITFLTRPNLKEGFSMLEHVQVLIAPDWKRGASYSVHKTLLQIGVDPKHFDLIIEQPSPTDWVYWQRGNLVPKVKWDPLHDPLWKRFNLSEDEVYVAVQPVAETNYGLWRNWPVERWHAFFHRLEKMPKVKVLLFGFGCEPRFDFPNVIDLRGKTSLFELLSILKNRCAAAVLPDSGILSTLYYLDAPFPIRVVSLWADPNHGILKQGVFSPNPLLRHSPLIGAKRDLSTVSAEAVIRAIFPAEPLRECLKAAEVVPSPIERTAAVILAGGQGSRLAFQGPKGTFSIRGKSLFEWICEKVPRDMPLAVMTSPLNHEETLSFFKKQQFFNRTIQFFQQDLLQMLDEKRNPTDRWVPAGNGAVFRAMMESGVLADFERQGIDLVSIVPVENILANPADPFLISHIRQTNADIAVKCIEKKDKEGSMGALITREGRLEIVEYTETDPNIESSYFYTGMMAMKLSFIRKMAEMDLPLHWVWKQTEGIHGWKGERFLFDVLPYADSSTALCYPREQIYAPLKNQKNLERILDIIDKLALTSI